MIIRVTPDAANYILARATEVYLELPPKIGCCIDIQEKPDVKLGPPQALHGYTSHHLEGVIVHVPKDFPSLELTITLSRLFLFRHLAVEGWNLI